MSEYIVCVDDLEEPYYRYTDIKPETVFGHRLREKIVRCRDCKEYNTVLYQHITCELLERYVKPNDFCSWGVKK